jgi:hypothetical protein
MVIEHSDSAEVRRIIQKIREQAFDNGDPKASITQEEYQTLRLAWKRDIPEFAFTNQRMGDVGFAFDKFVSIGTSMHIAKPKMLKQPMVEPKMIKPEQISKMLKAQTNKAKYLRFGVICGYVAANIGLFYAIKAGMPYGWEIWLALQAVAVILGSFLNKKRG